VPDQSAVPTWNPPQPIIRRDERGVACLPRRGATLRCGAATWRPPARVGHERRTLMGKRVDPGLHTAPGRPIDPAAYEQYIGRWDEQAGPALLAAAEVTAGCRVLDVATGAGEAALGAMSVVTAA